MLYCLRIHSGFSSYTDSSADFGGERAPTGGGGPVSCFIAQSIILASSF